MIYTHIPYTPMEHGNNLGYAYNQFMKMLPNDDDWACFLDHDAMFTTSNWYSQLSDIIDKNPNIGAFGARTNRINCTYQLVGNIDVYNHDIAYHREIGNHIQNKWYDDLLEIGGNKIRRGLVEGDLVSRGFSGVLILIQKQTWNKINGFKKDGFNNIDNDLRVRLFKQNIPFCIMNGVYVYHWYKADAPYKRAVDKFNIINETYEKDNKCNFQLKNIFLYNGLRDQLPR